MYPPSFSSPRGGAFLQVLHEKLGKAGALEVIRSHRETHITKAPKTAQPRQTSRRRVFSTARRDFPQIVEGLKIFFSRLEKMDTLPETNIASENRPPQ